MRAICKKGPGPGAELAKVADPKPASDELLIRVKRASICGSDMAIYNWNSWAPHRFPTPMVFGHEFCGDVVEAGSGTRDFKKGDFVSVESHVYCGLCYQCRNGQRHVCQQLKIIGVDCPGGFAEYARVPARCAWKHPDGKLAEVGSLMEPLGNAVYATLIEEVVGRSVVVMGCGPQGLFAIAVARASGGKPIIAVEGAPYRQKLALKMGADVVIDPGSGDAGRDILAKVSPGGADVVLEMSGAPAAIALGLKVLRSGGRFTAFGIPPGTLAIDWAGDVVFKGIRIFGVAGREIFQTWYTTERLLRTGAIDVKPVITHVYPAKDYEAAFQAMAAKDKRCGKVVLEF